MAESAHSARLIGALQVTQLCVYSFYSYACAWVELKRINKAQRFVRWVLRLPSVGSCSAPPSQAVCRTPFRDTGRKVPPLWTAWGLIESQPMTLSLHIKEFASVRLFHWGIKPHFRVFRINLLGRLICIANASRGQLSQAREKHDRAILEWVIPAPISRSEVRWAQVIRRAEIPKLPIAQKIIRL